VVAALQVKPRRVPGSRRRATSGNRYAELYSLAVAPEARGKGLGTRILDFADGELASRGIRDLQVAVMAGNDDALRFYERRGLRVAEVILYRFGR
jgi:ribosomal protein S18 acetylase RimI-like enzyme